MSPIFKDLLGDQQLSGSQIIQMKIYLLIASLLLLQVLGYRYVGTKNLQLANPPQSIQSLAPNVIVAQDGNTIYLYDTQNNYIKQSVVSDSDTPDPKIAGQLNLVLFKKNNTLFQMQPNDGPITINEPEAGDEWVYPLGLANNTVVYHSLDPIKADRWISYVSIGSDSSTVYTYELQNDNQNIFRGSGVVCLTPNEYYFVSGGICDADDQVLFFFRGDIDGIYNVFNLSIPGCNMPRPQSKETILLSSIDEGDDDRVHAVTYKLNAFDNPFMHSTQIINTVNSQYEEWIRFDTFNLQGIDYVGSNLYTADVELCRVLRHYPDAYKKAQNYDSILPPIVTDTAVNYQTLQLAVFNGTNAFSVFGFNGGTGKIQKLLFNTTSTSNFIDGDYYGGNLWVAKDSTSTLSSIYLEVTPNKTVSDIQSTNYTVVDYCTTPNQVLFSITQNNQIYTLNQNVFQYIGSTTNRFFRTLFSVALPSAVKSITCLNGNTVLIDPVNPGDMITTWQSDGSAFSRTGFIIKSNILHNQTHVTSNNIIFTNASNTSMLIYDFRLNLVTSQASLLLPPDAAFNIITTYANNIVFAIAGRGEINQPDSFEHYALSGPSLYYVGSYPLYGTSPVDYNKVLLLGALGRLSIDYGTQTKSFQVSYPPQSLRGYFYDQTTKDCQGYILAVFKSNPLPDVFDMLIVNSVNSPKLDPILERYTFTETTTQLLTKTSSVVLKNFVIDQMQMELSADRQKLLIYGVKQTNTFLYTVQVKNVNNLDTLFEKPFSDITSQDKVQAFGLYGSNFISAVTTKFFFINATFNILNLNLDIGSQGKISTDSSITAIDLYATCARCSFAAVSTLNSKLIQLLSLKTGITRGNITATCALRQLALSPDGGRIAYLCQNNGFYLYDDAVEQSYFLARNYTSISSFYFLTSSHLVIVNDGVVYHLEAVMAKNPSKAIQIGKIVKRSSSSNGVVQSVAINDNLQIYAYIVDPQKVQIYNAQGTLTGQFILNNSTETITGITFDSLNQLILTTDNNSLITLSPTACPDNSSVDGTTGYCACNPTFALIDSTCMCSAPLYLDGASCACEDGNYYVSETECAECNIMCYRCSGEGVRNCDSYSALFVIIIILSVLIVAGLFIFYYLRSRKGKTKLSEMQKSSSYKKKSVSSDALAERLVENGNEERMRLQI